MGKTVRIRFTETPEDQALYQTLLSTGETEYREQPTRQAKHLLRMALGQRPPDAEMLKRMGFPAMTADDVLCNLERRVALMQPKRAAKKKTNLTVLNGGRHDPQ